ncbi:MAG TPA: hypothetical protein VFB41_05210 [Solirubrobacteraceae bacterium]|nr:hypothetical protein [Solirubrobacteraceae bacterium]
MTGTVVPNEVRVALREGPLVGPVLSRVVGMLAARALCPVDRLDEALLLADAIAAHAPGHTLDGTLIVTVTTDADTIRLRVGPLREDGAEAVLADATLPGVGNVLERVADALVTERSDNGNGEELRLEIAFASRSAATPG